VVSLTFIDPLVLEFFVCDIIINHGVLIFADFVVQLSHENKNPTKYNFVHWLLPVMFETTNSRTQGSMNVKETTKFGANG
jgi:hypothetical protein